MTVPTIELKQEGIVRAGGYQATQWISALGGATDPSGNAPLFVLRNTAGVEALERVAEPADFVTYPVNELQYFEALGTGAGALLDALAGDTLTIAPAPDYWLQAGAPYTDAVFEVAALETLASGSAATLAPPNLLQLTDHAFTDADVGRWIAVTGFAAPRMQVLGVVGGVATVDAATTSPVTGTTWTLSRVRIRTDYGGGTEPRYFPTRESNLAWQVTRGATVVASGTRGVTTRTDPDATLYRDRRVTTVLGTNDAATALFAVVRYGVGVLQGRLAVMGTAYLGVQTYDFPPT